jgi:transposase-like protein
MLQIVLAGISTRKYKEVLPQMAEAVGVSKSAVSREIIEASEQVFTDLLERRFDAKDILIVYIDGLRFGEYHVLAAVGVDSEGVKHVLGIKDGASENATVVKALLEELVEKGVKPGRRRLYVIDGAKALRIGIDAVYGSDNPVQRCRNHKERNLQDHLPKDPAKQVVSAMKAAWRMEAKEGEAQLEKQAQWLEREWPSAAASLREGLSEMFTINRLGIPATLRRCLGSTNIIESSFSGTRGKTYKVTHWQNGAMALRWAASALTATEKNFRKIIGAHQRWQLKAYLDEPLEKDQMENRRKVG